MSNHTPSWARLFWLLFYRLIIIPTCTFMKKHWGKVSVVIATFLTALVCVAIYWAVVILAYWFHSF